LLRKGGFGGGCSLCRHQSDAHSLARAQGIRNLDGSDDPKISFYQTIKTLEKRLADPDVILNSFIIASTRHQQVDHWRDASG
jgi:hypothetical protein